jgi:methylglyoxal synthase
MAVEIKKIKRIALVAHDKKKRDLWIGLFTTGHFCQSTSPVFRILHKKVAWKF